MKKLRWAMDGEFWELDVSTPRTLEGLARPVPGDPIPLGLSRGSRLSRAKQLHFMQRFMTAPFVPSYAAASDGLALHRVLTIPFSENWFATLLGQFNLQKFWSSLMNESGETPPPLSSESSWRQQLQRIGRHLRNKSLYALGFSSELLLTPDDTLLLSLDSHSYSHGNKKTPRKKAVLHHKVFVLCCVVLHSLFMCCVVLVKKRILLNEDCVMRMSDRLCNSSLNLSWLINDNSRKLRGS